MSAQSGLSSSLENVAQKIMELLDAPRPISNGLQMRPDRFVAVRSLLEHPDIDGMNFLTLEKLVQEDGDNRYELLYEPYSHSLGMGEHVDQWWIRKSRSLLEPKVEHEMRRVTQPREFTLALHITGLESWPSIKRTGISRMSQPHIYLQTQIPDYIASSAEPKEEQLLIYINLKKAMDAGIKFYASSAGLATPGDEAGFLRPRFFQYVYVRVIQRKTLLGKPSQPWLVTPKRPLSTTRLRLGLAPRRR